MRSEHWADSVSDVQLVRQAQQGDKAAFAELFTRYEGRIYGYLYRMVGNRAWAEDLTQEAFIRAHQHLNRLGPPYDFKSWIYRIAGNLAIDGLRRYKDEIPLPNWDAGEATAPEPADERAGIDPEQEAHREEVRQAVWQTLHRLPENYRQILLLRELEGLSYQEIAAVIGISLDNVRVTLHRARLAFRDLYGLQVMIEEGRWACQALNELLSAEIDGELDRSARRRVKKHIESCPVCQRTRKELLAVSNLLALLAPVFPPPTLRPRFLQRLEQVPPPQPASSPPPPPPAPPGRGGGSSGPGRFFWLALIGGIGGALLLAATVLIALALFAPGLPPTPPSALPPTATRTPAVLPNAQPTPTPTAPLSPAPSSTASPTPTPSPPTGPPVSPSPTPVTPTPTATPTASPTPAPSIAFWADATTVPAGSCTTLHWETANVAGVYFNGQGVPGTGSHQTCPCSPETHTLDVLLRDGSHDVRTITINVTGSCVPPTPTPTPTPTPDTVPPPVPEPIGPGTTDPSNPQPTSCPVTLRWNPVSDPSGVVYSVRLEEWVRSTGWQLAGSWYPVSATEVEVGRSQCNYASYRWRVAAEDGAGNSSDGSVWMYYTIPIP